MRAEVDWMSESVDVGEVLEVLYVASAGPVVPYPQARGWGLREGAL